MNASELLREEASKLRHAIVRDVIIDCEGKVEEMRDFHYLTCVRCSLERSADEYDKQRNKAG
jgi:hypothetical protein